MKFSGERAGGVESMEGYSSKIVLHFFRHGEKEKADKPDKDIELTPRGRNQALALGREGAIGNRVAFGSSRRRTLQTAGLAMAGGQEEITGEETLSELQEKLNQDLGFGSKIASDPRLDYVGDNQTPVGLLGEEAAQRGKYLDFLVRHSDNKARELSDTKFTTYKKLASNMAGIVMKYLRIADRWDAIVAKTKRTAGHDSVMERYLGTHQGNAEAFIARYLELTQGVAARDQFVDFLDGAGFDYTEGCSVQILNSRNQNPKVHIFYQGERRGESFVLDEDISPDVLESIITEH